MRICGCETVDLINAPTREPANAYMELKLTDKLLDKIALLLFELQVRNAC
jgi:hypothetical protein